MKVEIIKAKLEDIAIPAHFAATTPRPEKVAECYGHYRSHGEFDRLIAIDQSKTLLDGYVAYLVAKMLGIKTVDAVQVSDRKAGKATVEPEGPAKATPEPVKLYCVKGYKPGELLTKGRVYEAARVGCRSFSLRYDGGGEVTIMSGLCHFGTSSEPIVGHHLIPLVSRPAKVGEWVYIDDPEYKWNGIIGRVVETKRKVYRVEHETVWFDRGGGKEITNTADSTKLLVLDGYQPEEYYNGKVVCTSVSVAGEEEFFTEGKVYKFIDGIVTCNTGSEYNRGEPIKTVNELQGDDWFTKFIPYLGEA